MKKKYLFLLFLILTIKISAISIDNSTDTLKQRNTQNISNWSISVAQGTNRFDGDINDGYSFIRALKNYVYGGVLEYNIAPAWSVGVDYYYMLTGAKDVSDSGFVKADYEGKIHTVGLFTSISLVRAFLPKTKSKWDFCTQIGLGHAWYNSDYRTDNDGLLINSGAGGKIYREFNDVIRGGKAMYYTISLLAEYYFYDNFSIGLKGQILSFNTDWFERRINLGVKDDYVELMTLQFRWRFNR